MQNFYQNRLLHILSSTLFIMLNILNIIRNLLPKNCLHTRETFSQAAIVTCVRHHKVIRHPFFRKLYNWQGNYKLLYHYEYVTYKNHCKVKRRETKQIQIQIFQSNIGLVTSFELSFHRQIQPLIKNSGVLHVLMKQFLYNNVVFTPQKYVRLYFFFGGITGARSNPFFMILTEGVLLTGVTASYISPTTISKK